MKTEAAASGASRWAPTRSGSCRRGAGRLEAHLEGCPACRAEAESLASVSRLLPHADPERFGPAPRAAAGAGQADRGGDRRRAAPRPAPAAPALRPGFGGAAAAVAAAVLAIFVLSGGEAAAPSSTSASARCRPG